jgi:hypothetical protein
MKKKNKNKTNKPKEIVIKFKKSMQMVSIGVKELVEQNMKLLDYLAVFLEEETDHDHMRKVFANHGLDFDEMMNIVDGR